MVLVLGCGEGYHKVLVESDSQHRVIDLIEDVTTIHHILSHIFDGIRSMTVGDAVFSWSKIPREANKVADSLAKHSLSLSCNFIFSMLPLPLSNCSCLRIKRVVMKRAKSMAQAAWTRPNLDISSWSCMGPRRRVTSTHSNSKEEGSSPRSPTSDNVEGSEPLLCSPKKGINARSMNLPVSSSVDEWSSEIEYPNRNSPDAEVDDDLNHSDNTMDHERYEDQMSEVELWQQLEHELYDRPEGEEADVVKEIREEEEAAITEVVGQTQNSVPDMKEVHRFFPPGKIMHIVTLHSDSIEHETDGSPTSTSSDDSQPEEETKIGIFLTSRSLYSKLRLSQTMISDHFMPIYRKQIERLIKDLDEESTEDHRTQEVTL